MAASEHRTQTTSPSAASSSSGLVLGLVCGVTIGAAGAAVAFVTRGRSAAVNAAAVERTMLSSLLQESAKELRHGLQQDIVREVNQSMVTTTSHVSSQLKSVAAVPNELLRMNQRLDSVASIFRNNKERGTFGEIQLQQLVRDVFAPNKYDFEVTLSNKKRVDCLLNMPQPLGKICVDSKFPLDDFRAEESSATNNSNDALLNGLQQNGKLPNAQNRYTKQKDALRKHINDIATKYIIPGETADCAILFLPSESLFLQVVQDHTDVLTEAYRKRVWIACPTTLHAVLTVLQGVTLGLTLQEETSATLGQVQKLTQDVDRLLKRYETAVKSVDKAKEDLRLMNVSIEKISKSRDALAAHVGLHFETCHKSRTKKVIPNSGVLDSNVSQGATTVEQVIPTVDKRVNGSVEKPTDLTNSVIRKIERQ